MSTYGELMACTLWAAVVVWFASEAAQNGEDMAVAQAREGYCVVVMGQEVDRLASQVGAYLEAYTKVLEPAIASAEDQ